MPPTAHGVSLLERIAAILDQAGARYALIGAAAMAVHGVGRAGNTRFRVRACLNLQNRLVQITVHNEPSTVMEIAAVVELIPYRRQDTARIRAAIDG